MLLKNDRSDNKPLGKYPPPFTWPIQLEFGTWGYGVAFPGVGGHCAGAGNALARWTWAGAQVVAIGARTLVLLLLFLIICGVRWTRITRS